MADSAEFSAFSQRELRSLAKTFQVMGDEAVDKSKAIAYEISQISKKEIAQAGYGRTVSAKGVRRVVDGASISRTSKTGRLSYGFAGQRFSGGGSTKILWRGLEFGSKNFKQFPSFSGRFGRGSKGYFIFPTLRKIQPQLTLKYIKAMNDAVKGWAN
jgi:hypothetical protein